MPEQTQSNIEQTPLVHQPAPAVANPPPQSTTPKPTQRNGDRDSDSEGDEPEVARDVAIGGMGAIVGGVVVGATMMKLGTHNAGAASGGNSDAAAKELQALKGEMLKVSELNFADVGQVNKDTLKKAITHAIYGLQGWQDRGWVAKDRLVEFEKFEKQFEKQQKSTTTNIETDLQNEKRLKEELKVVLKDLLAW